MEWFTHARAARSTRGALRILLTGGVLAASAVACSEPVAAADGSDALEGRYQVVETVSVTPSVDTILVGGTTQLTAKVTDQRGRDRTRDVTWSSASASVATVSSSGLVRGVAAGTVKITATSGWRGAQGTATIVVLASSQPAPAPAPVATVTVSPASASIDTGKTTQLTATLRDRDGNVLTGRAISWISSSPAIATVSSSGLVKGVAAGSATVTATSEGMSGRSTITVVAPASAPPPEPEPAPGGVVDTIFYDGFESGSLSLWQDGVTPSKHQVITDASLAAGGSRLLKVTMPAGGDGGWLTRFFMPGYDSVFVRLRVRYGQDWNGGAKLLSLRGSPINNQWGGFGNAGQCPDGTDFFSSNLTLDATYNPGPMLFYAYYPGMPNCWGDSGNRTGAATYANTSRGLAKERWYTVEYWVKLNTVGQRNSEQRFWVDGQLWGEWNGLSFRTTNDLKLNSVQLNLNATGSSTARTLYIDEVLVTKQRP